MSFAVAVIGDGVEVRQSGIPGAGNGLWAAQHFDKNELITEYQGKLIDHEKALKLRTRGRHTHIRVLNSMHLYIDGLKQPESGRGGASFANDARDTDITNAVFMQKFDGKLGRDRVFLKALRDIKFGEEIFVSYGKTYWQTSKQDAQPHKQPVQSARQQQLLHVVSSTRCSKRKQQHIQSWRGPKAQQLLSEEQSSQQSTDTVEHGVRVGAPPMASRLQLMAYPGFAQVQLAAKQAQSQLIALAQRWKQQIAQQAQQQEQQQRSDSNSSSQQSPVMADCRRSARVRSRQEQQQAAAAAAKTTDALDRGWVVKQPRSPTPLRRGRQVDPRSSNPVHSPSAADPGDALGRGWAAKQPRSPIPLRRRRQVDHRSSNSG